MTDQPSAAEVRRRYAETAIQKTALGVGVVFLLIGIAGFIPGITQNTEGMSAAGDASEAMLFGVFQVSVLHNIVHLLFGVIGLAVAAHPQASRQFLIWGGVVYIALWVYGLFAAGRETLNFVPLNNADNWLHLILGIGMLVLGLFVARDLTTRRAGTTGSTTS